MHLYICNDDIAFKYIKNALTSNVMSNNSLQLKL